MRVLVAGWFSFEQGHATAGDLLSKDVVCGWLDDAGYAYDVAFAPPFPGGVDWSQTDPTRYSHVVFVCGPFENGEVERAFLGRFAGCRLVGVNLSMALPLDVWNPFDVLFERDSSARSHPDLVFLSAPRRVPVAGVCLVEPHPGALVRVAARAVERLVASSELVRVDIDTRLDHNAVGLRSPAEVESLIARMDVCITTRLHGMVLALKNGIPAIAIDPVVGGAKIRRQADILGWPLAFTVDTVTDRTLVEALAFALTDSAREQAMQCAARAAAILRTEQPSLMAELKRPDGAPGGRFDVEMESAGARTATRPRPAAIGPPGNDATPLVSIIVCHTQPGGCLGEPEAIDSALRQPGGRVEILVVHDGATAPPIVDHPAVRYIQQEGSPAAARNRGVRESRGTFLVFLDPGDQLLPGALAASLDHLLVDPTLAFVCGRARRTTDDGAAVSEDPAPSVADDPYATLLEENHIRVPATVMYRREVVASHGGFEELAADEYELQLRLARSVPVHAHAEIVVERRWCVTARRDEVERRLFAELEVVRAQRPHVANDQARRTAYEKGLSRRRSACAQALVRRAAGHLREGSGEQSLRAWLTAWRLSPAAALKATGWGLARQGRDRWKSVSRAFTAGVSRP